MAARAFTHTTSAVKAMTAGESEISVEVCSNDKRGSRTLGLSNTSVAHF